MVWVVAGLGEQWRSEMARVSVPRTVKWVVADAERPKMFQALRVRVWWPGARSRRV